STKRCSVTCPPAATWRSYRARATYSRSQGRSTRSRRWRPAGSPGTSPAAERLAGHFPDNLAGVLVVAQALEPRMAQLAVVGPLAEADLADEPGRDPVHAARAWQAALGEGRGVALHPRQTPCRLISVRLSKPVPTFPAYTRAPSGS